jgi:hypothetical protein
MLKGILGFLLFVFVFAIFIMLLTGSYILKKIREFRKAAEQAADQQAFNYRTETGRQRQQYSNRQRTQSASSQTTQTATGETIIDNRQQKRENKKIFDDSDGEYVEFEEA